MAEIIIFLCGDFLSSSILNRRSYQTMMNISSRILIVSRLIEALLLTLIFLIIYYWELLFKTTKCCGIWNWDCFHHGRYHVEDVEAGNLEMADMPTSRKIPAVP